MTTDAAGGVWSYSQELIRQLGALGCEVVIASLGGPLSEEERAEARRLTNAELHESSYRLEWMEQPWQDVERATAWIRKLLRDTRCDLLHFNCFGPAAARWDVPVVLVAHSCVWSWWRAVHGEDPGPEWRRYRDCVVDAIAGADLVVAPTRAMLDAFRDCYPEAGLGDAGPGRRAAVIPNGIDVSRWPAGDGRKGAFVFAAGRVWDEAKNLRQLARIAPELGRPVVIAGEHGRGAFDAGRSAVLLGRLSRARTAEYYRSAAAFAHPARYEPFGLAVLEAALSGCPLVLGDIASLRELWDGVALFVDPDDPAALRDTLQRLIDDPDERRARGEAARARALRYGARRMAADYVERYRSLLDGTLLAEGAA
ncbi:MAG: glycosyltransferase family 4 protein [Gammaproteobacteria bacterium]|nr:glycosyltransferase family 4 protein [Gammaproteobacteria bacterium]